MESYLHGNAGCLIKRNREILVIKHAESRKWDIPSGAPLNNKEPANETARRETLEEAGLEVKILDLLDCFEDKFYIYSCHVISSIPEELAPSPHHENEILQVAFLPIESLTYENVRFPEVLDKIKKIFNEIPDSFVELVGDSS